METYSFEDAVGYFEEEQILERQAKNIIEQERQKQQQAGNLRCPFVDLTNCTPLQKAVLNAHFQHTLTRQTAKFDGAEREITRHPFPGEQESAFPWVPGAYQLSSKLNTIVDIRSLQHKNESIREPNPYEIMHMVLHQVPLVNYNGVFYVRKGCIFQQITDEDLRALVFSIAEPVLANGKSPTLLGNVCGLLKDYYGIKIRQTTETTDRVFFTNGVYDLTRHELLPPLPTDFVTAYLPFQYNPDNKECPVFDRFLLDISGGNPAVISLIWEIIGYLLSSDMSAKSFFLLQGVGDSGKSVLGNLISNMFNQEALAHLDIYRFKDKFSTSALLGKRLNICMDLPRARISREAIGVIKMLTGDDTITVEQKFRPSASYKPTCKLLFGSNFPLMPADNDPAFCSRLVTVPFPYPIPKEQQDKHLLEKLLMERSAIAVKALDAYLLLKARNYQFLQVQGAMCPVTGYIADAELMDTFLTECCVFSAEAYTFTADLLAAYNQFRASRGAPPLTDSAIFSRQLGQFCARPIQGRRRRMNGANLNGYQGIGLRIPGSEICEEG